ncbi:hypothetical protein [Pseudomonas phage ANB1]|nr:hypothetical protein [Pseudomonas phage ANB1]
MDRASLRPHSNMITIIKLYLNEFVKPLINVKKENTK